MWPIPETISFAELPPPVTVRYNNTRISTLNLRGVNPLTCKVSFCKCQSGEWNDIAKLLQKFNELRELEFLNCFNAPEAYDGVAELVHLTRLTIDGCEISIVNVSKFKRLSGLRELSLNRNLVQVEEVVDRAAESFPCLQKLSVCNSLVQGASASQIKCQPFEMLQELRISYSKVGAIRTKFIVRALPNLRRLHIDSNDIGDEGMYSVACCLGKLQILNAAYNGVGLEGPRALSRVTSIVELRIELKITELPLHLWKGLANLKLVKLQFADTRPQQNFRRMIIGMLARQATFDI